MRLRKIVLFSIVFISFTYTAVSQRITLKSGNLDFLKGEKTLKVEYVYDGMSVGKFDKEEDYIAKKKADYNKDEPGRGDTWAEAWKGDRKGRFEPKFEALIEKYLTEKGVSLGKNESAKYTLILKTVRTEPGFNVYVTRKPAEIDVMVHFVETANPKNTLATIEMERCPGNALGGRDYDTGERIQEAYAKCGKELGKYLAKNAFKSK